jgi:hypothetical protein
MTLIGKRAQGPLFGGRPEPRVRTEKGKLPGSQHHAVAFVFDFLSTGLLTYCTSHIHHRVSRTTLNLYENKWMTYPEALIVLIPVFLHRGPDELIGDVRSKQCPGH